MEIKQKFILIMSIIITLGIIFSLSFAQDGIDLDILNQLDDETDLTQNDLEIDYGAQSATPASGRTPINKLNNLEHGLLEYYNFEDDSQYILQGSPNKVQGKLNDAYEFNCNGGSSSCAQIRDDLMFAQVASEFTYSFWINLDNYPKTQGAIIGEYTSQGPHTRNYLTLVNDGRITFDQYYNSGNNIYSEFTIPKQSWNFVTLTRNGDSFNFYLNGELINTVSKNEGYAGSIPSHFGLGSRTHSGINNYGIDGKLDEVGIWNRALSSEEIETLYNNGEGILFNNQAQSFNQETALSEIDAIVIIKEEFNSQLSLTSPQENMNVLIDSLGGELVDETFDLMYSDNSKRYLINYNSTNTQQISSISNVLNVIQIEPTSEVNLRQEIENFILNSN